MLGQEDTKTVSAEKGIDTNDDKNNRGNMNSFGRQRCQARSLILPSQENTPKEVCDPVSQIRK